MQPIRFNAGLTLVELMITLAVIAIIAAIGWPMYDEQQMRSRRSDAVMALLAAKAQMQNCYSRNGTYTGCAPSSALSPKGYYAISVAIIDDVTLPAGKQGAAYTLTAAPVGGTAQAGDSDCAAITLSNTDVKGGTTTGCWVK